MASELAMQGATRGFDIAEVAVVMGLVFFGAGYLLHIIFGAF